MSGRMDLVAWLSALGIFAAIALGAAASSDEGGTCAVVDDPRSCSQAVAK